MQHSRCGKRRRVRRRSSSPRSSPTSSSSTCTCPTSRESRSAASSRRRRPRPRFPCSTSPPSTPAPKNGPRHSPPAPTATSRGRSTARSCWPRSQHCSPAAPRKTNVGTSAPHPSAARRPIGPVTLLERGERGGQEYLVLLGDEAVAAARRWPDTPLGRFGAHLRPLIQARVRPDVHEAVGASELDAAREHQRRELRPLGQRPLPGLRHLGQHARLERVVAQLEDRAELAAPDLGHELERHDDLGVHLADELLDAGVPLRVLRRLAADALTLAQILVRPHVDDLVEWPDLRVPEREQLRVLLAILVRLAETLLDLGQAAWSDAIGTDLVDHAGLLSGGRLSDVSWRATAYGQLSPASTGRGIQSGP